MIVIPDRDTPGISDRRLREPHPDGRLDADLTHVLRLGRAVGHVEEAGEEREEDRDLPRLAQPLGDQVLPHGADDRRRHRRRRHVPGDPLVGGLDPPPPERSEPRSGEADDVVARSR